MRIVLIVLAALSIAAGLLSTLMMTVLIFAGMANTSALQQRHLTQLLIAFLVGGLLSAGGSFALIIMKHPGWGIIVGLLPVLGIIGVFIWSDLKR